ncbi:aminopeptidase P family protein [Candidatus Woesearchaeota archaeon]|jgi:Xaa-Pro aminopeptidase|nr:aminopeptidase P family protein [Candidatus Woesearchaeota archaeon]MBT6520360.1 aminopeptidase P family protein [Candidatus Woesearchaeota archaeon]MBT7368558.1 aminopeptidase P family protein [Candidatus Woesearchaeota archaeon]
MIKSQMIKSKKNRNKIKHLQTYLTKEKIKCAFFVNMDFNNPDSNFFYLTNFKGYGILVIDIKSAKLYVPEMEYDSAKSKVSKFVKVIKSKNLFSDVKSKINIAKNQKIGIDGSSIKLNNYKKFKKLFNCKFTDISSLLFNLRKIKTESEIKKIKKAVKITDQIFHKLFWNIKKFNTETDIEAFLTSETIKAGCELSFRPIVASGAGGATPHYKAQPKKIRKGFLVIDFGLKYNGYCSDLTRILYVGTPSKKEIENYYLVLSAQKKAIKSCVVGTKYSDVHKISVAEFGSKAKNFIHNIGHGVGIDVHEAPNVKVKKGLISGGDILEQNMVITIEPGLYFPGKYGIRIEDDLLITSRGPKVLSTVGKNLLIINY